MNFIGDNVFKRKQKYTDALASAMHSTNVWKGVSILFGVGLCYTHYQNYNLNNNVLKSLKEVQYIALPNPGIAAIVRPGELPKSYVEGVYRRVVANITAYDKHSIEDAFKENFELFYSQELIKNTQVNLKRFDYISEVKKRNIVSTFEFLPEKSKFEWCPQVQYYTNVKGVACGIVTGIQRKYTTKFEDSSPLGQKEVSFLIYGVNKHINFAPGALRGMFAIQIVRLKQGDYNQLQEELRMSVKEGVLPPMGGQHASN